MFEELLSQWQIHKHLTNPPAEPIKLWQEETRSIWIANHWGAMIPYGPVDHGDGHQNHGYQRTKSDPAVIHNIPEVQGWPEYEEFLLTINSAASPIESVGCEKGFFPSEGTGDAVVKLGSYLEVIFTEPLLNEQPENFLLLASRLLPGLRECEKWWADIEIALERFKGIPGTKIPWGLFLRITNFGRNNEEARKFWGVTLKRLGNAIAQLPSDFRYSMDAKDEEEYEHRTDRGVSGRFNLRVRKTAGHISW